jgi:signal transduction histidine kinase
MGDQISLYLERARMAARGRALGVVTEVRPVIDAIVRTLLRIHADRTIATTVTCDPLVFFQGEKQDLEEAIGNLLENAFKWAGSKVRVTVEQLSAGQAEERLGRLRVRVEDDGPGLTDAQKHEAVKRGSRLDETTPGSGLGRSIVAELAALYDGSIALHDSDLGGLRVDLDLPGTKADP